MSHELRVVVGSEIPIDAFQIPAIMLNGIWIATAGMGAAPTIEKMSPSTKE